ncbi:hypothetical protein [Pseudohoeflea coraliihabitans]|uniref:Uncharacterized protein n=1 Tax=Pseudohoeflea coraliihabitans TaxID=2860393 RepID=A0ABS6WP35_9HYPH|nr:hypothetical protein [Pseudohoeflea sp. DP4N28-3]MBW3096839.1 hypothetical protein [Pseudohoeflea sp. DP4N28-3]
MADLETIASDMAREDPALVDAILRRREAPEIEFLMSRERLADRCRMRARFYPAWRIPQFFLETGADDIGAVSLMTHMGFDHRRHPIISFASLCRSFSTINRVLPAYGWQVTRTGGTPNDRYSLVSLSGG